MASMQAKYGEKKGKQVFYASKNAGKIKGVDRGFYHDTKRQNQFFEKQLRIIPMILMRIGFWQIRYSS